MIPARLQSSRLPEKALLDIMGVPMVIHTCKRAQMAQTLDAVFLATDSKKIKRVAEEANIAVIMTSKHHQTGTDRIAEAVESIESDIIVNIQGDEPLVYPDHIDKIVLKIIDDESTKVAVGVTKYERRNCPSDIKAVLDNEDNILYCSRADIPSNARSMVHKQLKMCFIVGFQSYFLQKFNTWEQTPLEKIEFNEYLRIIENGEKIKAVRIENAQISVDTPDDLEIVRKLMKKDTLRKKYSL